MTFEEFANKIDRMRNLPSWDYRKDKIVRVRLDGQVSIGPSAASDVKHIYAGNDWDANSIFIQAEEPLIRLSCHENMKRKNK